MMVYALLSIFVIEFSLYFFGGMAGTPASAILSLFLDPTGIQHTDLWNTVFYAIVAIGITGIISTFYFQVNQWAYFAISCAILLTFVSVLTQLWSYLNNGIGEGFGPMVATIIVTPLILLYITAVIEWSRFNQ